MSFGCFALLWILVAPLAGQGSQPDIRRTKPRSSQQSRQQLIREAKGVAEVETGGRAVAARRVALNGTCSPDGLGGVEVLVHLPGQRKGWRCFIDSNTLKLRRQEAIPNPGPRPRRTLTGS